jgi:hypothetical protein
MTNSKIDVAKPFGPSMAKVKIPDPIIKSINEYIDNIIDNKSKSHELNHGTDLAGDVTQEIILEKEIMEKSGWTNFLASCVYKWIEIETKKKVTKFRMRTSWVVRQFKNEYNPVHWHNGHISGAGFLKVPKTFGEYSNKKKKLENYRGGNLTFIHGQKHFLSNSILSVKPQVGDFYLFPNYLMHTVYPFKGTDDERRSISFNADIDEEIYNVYEN